VSRRSYDQYCALSRALDLIGERWTLLVVRDLILGPKRFTDLLEGLPGLARNLLSTRLRHLEQEGIVARRDLPPPAASTVYELTADGRELAYALGPLTTWGAKRLGSRRRGEHFSPVWIAMAMANSADRDAARGVRETYQYDVDGVSFHVSVDDGVVVPHTGPAEKPDLVVRLSPDTLVEILSWELSPRAAVRAGRMVVDGPAETFARSLKIVAGGRR
jgi:DNA-binding HxlR family transcriptional regulator/putative sterol carrier protein